MWPAEFSATVGQDCVVTLEPIENEVEEADRPGVRPGGGAGHRHEEGDAGRIDAVDAPEPLIGGSVDLGAIATEFLILGIDPYPRKAGAAIRAASQGGRHRRPVRGAGGAQKEGG